MREGIDTDVAAPGVVANPFKQISWGAVFAGLVVALVVQLVLGMIGLSIGASTVDPTQEGAPGSGLGIGAGVWFAIQTIASLFAGGWVAGRMSGAPRRFDSALHGVLAWGLATLATAYLLTTTIGGAISGATGILERSISMLGSGVANVASTTRDEGVGATGKRGEMGDMAAMVGRMMQGGQVSEADKQKVVDLMVTQMGMSKAQAQQMVDQVTARAQSAQQQLPEARAAVEQQAREAGEAVASGVARAAAWSALAMVLGGIAAALGGYFSRSRDRVVRAGFAAP